LQGQTELHVVRCATGIDRRYAILHEEDVPAGWARYIQIKREFFTTATGLGSPGGAAQVGPIAADHPGLATSPIP
jgi:hypothetical protein